MPYKEHGAIRTLIIVSILEANFVIYTDCLSKALSLAQSDCCLKLFPGTQCRIEKSNMYNNHISVYSSKNCLELLDWDLEGRYSIYLRYSTLADNQG